jgi:6-pyruvoyltetrahydropterin/6-carboxytetrahydropterin synthase
MVYLTRRERFNAAHKLWVEAWSEEENFERFGKCANKNWHGHNYELFVTVKGQPDPVTGFIIDVKKLSKIIKAAIIDKVDHCNLNLDVPFVPRGMQPTTEKPGHTFLERTRYCARRLRTALHKTLRNGKHLC